MEKLPLNKIKTLSPRTLLVIIGRMKKFLKTNNVVKKMFEDYNISIEEMDIIPMRFDDLEVSARTDHGIITFNYKLLADGDFLKDYMYAVHEIEHWLQQTTGDGPTQGAEDGDYLENPYEQEGFQRQIEYLDQMYGKNEADKYVEHLLDHHDVKDDEEREEKKDKLMDKIDD